MKIEAGRIEAFLKNPGDKTLVLIYGPDSTLAAGRALTLAKSVIGHTSDAFRYAEPQDPTRLLEEATAASLLGGRRVIRLRDAGESAVKPAERILALNPDSLTILEAGDLTPKSKLRALAEKHPNAAAIACYAVDSARLPKILTDRLRAAGVTIDQDAAAHAAQNILGEEAAIAQAVELLTLYAGAARHLTLPDVTAALSDGGEGSIQDAIDATLTGDPVAADRAITLSYDEGVSPVAILRIFMAELMRLRVLAAGMNGASPAEAVSAARPPIFFKRIPTFTKALSLWTEPALTSALETALTAEAACKTTHIPDAAYCRQTLLTLATRARPAPRR